MVTFCRIFFILLFFYPSVLLSTEWRLELGSGATLFTSNNVISDMTSFLYPDLRVQADINRNISAGAHYVLHSVTENNVDYKMTGIFLRYTFGTLGRVNKLFSSEVSILSSNLLNPFIGIGFDLVDYALPIGSGLNISLDRNGSYVNGYLFTGIDYNYSNNVGFSASMALSVKSFSRGEIAFYPSYHSATLSIYYYLD